MVSMKLILSRFDFYSNYIGVSQIFGGGLPGYVCLPLVENVFSKIVFYPFGGLDCISLGSVLPGELYEFFRDKGTSFAIVGGFFALPLEDALPYFLSYFSVLLVASIIVFRFINVRVYSSFFVYLALVLLFQGWMYQFFYNFLGFLLGVFLQRFVWSKGSRNAIGAGAALASKVAIRSN